MTLIQNYKTSVTPHPIPVTGVDRILDMFNQLSTRGHHIILGKLYAKGNETLALQPFLEITTCP